MKLFLKTQSPEQGTSQSAPVKTHFQDDPQ